MTMRWNREKRDKLLNLIDKYNNKIRRLKEKEDFDNSLIPEKMDYFNLVSNINNKKDYDREVKLMNVFIKRGSEKISIHTKRGGKVPKYMEEQNKIKMKKINEDRKKQRKLYENEPLTDRGKKINKNNRFSNDKLDHLNPIKYNYETKSQKDIEMFNKSLKEYNISVEKANKTYVENYRSSIDTVFAEPERKKIEKAMEEISDEDILKMLYTDKNLLIDFNYEDLIDYDVRFESVLEGWKRVSRNKKKNKNKKKNTKKA